MFEGAPNQESSESIKERLLAALENGSTDAQELLNEWITKEENEVMTCSEEERPRRQALFELERVDVYLAAREPSDAKTSLIEAYIVARQEGLSDLMHKAVEKAGQFGINSAAELLLEADKYLFG